MKLNNKKKLFLLCIVLVSILSATIVYAVGNNNIYEQKLSIENDTRTYFNSWESPEYDGWVCSEKSEACMVYIRDTLGYPTVLVYGHSQDFKAHKWVLVFINGAWYELESTNFTFQNNHDMYSDMFAQLFKGMC